MTSDQINVMNQRIQNGSAKLEPTRIAVGALGFNLANFLLNDCKK